METAGNTVNAIDPKRPDEPTMRIIGSLRGTVELA